MNRRNESTLIAAWLVGASVLLAVAVLLGVLLLCWSANSLYAWGIG